VDLSESKPGFTRLQVCRDYGNAWFVSDFTTLLSIKTAFSWLWCY